MTYVYDADTDTSRFVVLDAATMSAKPVASVDLPRIPYGFHGSWIPRPSPTDAVASLPAPQ